MYSKLKVLIFVFPFLFLACSYENQSKDDVLEVKFGKSSAEGGLSCLSDFKPLLQAYIGNQLSSEALKKFFSCSAEAITLLTTYGGKNQSQLTSTEITHFVSRRIAPIDIATVDAILEVKSILVGGDSSLLKYNERIKLVQLLNNEIYQGLKRLQPHARYLFSGLLTPQLSIASKGNLEEAGKELSLVLGHLGKSIQSNHPANFEMSRFQKLFAIFAGHQPLATGALTNLFQEFKFMIMAGSKSFISVKEWPLLFKNLGSAYSIWVKHKNFVAGRDFYKPSATEGLKSILDELHSMISQGLKLHNEQVYANNDALLLLSSVARVTQKSFLNLDEVSTGKLWWLLIDKVFAKESDPSGMNQAKLDRIKSHFDDWESVQTFANHQVINGTFDPENKNLGSMRGLLKRPWSLSYDSLGRINIGQTESFQHSIESLAQINILRAIATPLMAAFTAEEDKATIKFPQGKVLYESVKPILVGLGLVEQNNTSFYKTVFRDANLFMPSSVGNNILTLDEVVDFVHYAMSVSRFQGAYLAEVSKDCEQGSEVIWTVNKSCYFQSVVDKQSLVYGHMPGLAKFLNTEKDNKLWFEYLVFVSRAVGANANIEYLTATNIFQMNMLTHYVEIFLKRYDENSNGTLDVPETIQFVDSNLPIIGFAVGDQKAINRRDFYQGFVTYLLKFGEAPLNNKDPLAGLRRDVWIEAPNLWSYEANRSRLVEALSGLIGQ